MIKEKFSKLKKIEFSKKTRKIIITAAISFVVFMFFIWLGVGMYVSVPEERRPELWPMYGMYAVFPTIIFILGVKRVHAILNGEDDSDDDGEEIPEEEKEE